MWKRWQLCHATDFQSLMYPCFTFCRILGIFPYKINASTFKASKPHYILSTVIICVYCVVELSLIHNVIYKIIDFGDVRNFEALCFYTFSCFIAITTHVLSGPRMRLLQTILEISSKLPSESHQKLSRLIHIKDILGTILSIVQVCIFFSKTNMFEFTCASVLIVLFTIYFEVLMFQINMLYVNCVCVLKTCFKRINDNLTHMQRLLLNEIKLNDRRLRLIEQRNQLLLEELKALKKQHLKISETVHMLNITFSLQLLVIIVMSFSEITFELYAYVVRWQNGVFISLDWRFFDALLVSMTYYIMKIMFLVWACETGKNQVKEFATTIHDLLNSTRDEQIKDELQLFSLQVLHCKNTFLTKGLTVDATLLTAIVGSITTYMLILIQFLITSHSCD